MKDLSLNYSKLFWRETLSFYNTLPQLDEILAMNFKWFSPEHIFKLIMVIELLWTEMWSKRVQFEIWKKKKNNNVKKPQQLATIPCKFFFCPSWWFVLSYFVHWFHWSLNLPADQMLDKMSYPILPAMSSFNALNHFML